MWWWLKMSGINSHSQSRSQDSTLISRLTREWPHVLCNETVFMCHSHAQTGESTVCLVMTEKRGNFGFVLLANWDVHYTVRNAGSIGSRDSDASFDMVSILGETQLSSFSPFLLCPNRVNVNSNIHDVPTVTGQLTHGHPWSHTLQPEKPDHVLFNEPQLTMSIILALGNCMELRVTMMVLRKRTRPPSIIQLRSTPEIPGWCSTVTHKRLSDHIRLSRGLNSDKLGPEAKSRFADQCRTEDARICGNRCSDMCSIDRGQLLHVDGISRPRNGV
jgi:hypothetical protein